MIHRYEIKFFDWEIFIYATRLLSPRGKEIWHPLTLNAPFFPLLFLMDQTRALRNGLDVLVGTPGRIIDHINRGNLRLNECDIVVLDEADEMLNMGFADDVETILAGVGSNNDEKTQCLLFSATTPDWVKEIGRSYQQDVLAIDSTTAEGGGARVATTVRHMAVQLPPGADSKKAILEDIIAIEISRDRKGIGEADSDDDEDDGIPVNKIAQAAAAKKRKSNNAMQQKIFGKTIVFTETKREADELVSGGVFKSLTAQVCTTIVEPWTLLILLPFFFRFTPVFHLFPFLPCYLSFFYWL